MSAGSFSYDPAARRWVWSEGLYRVHGYRPGDIVPTTELILAHVHPEDRSRTRELMDRVLGTGNAFSEYRRLIDASGRVRQVLVCGVGVRGSGGAVARVHGVITDLTRALQRETRAAADTAVERSAESRAVIEQLKGVLMYRVGVDADTAFGLILARSQQLNIRVRDLAETTLRALTEGDTAPLDAYPPPPSP